MKILPKEFYARDTVIVARELVGKLLVREYHGTVLSGIITETESYQSDDPACHAFRGKTARTQALFGPVGHAYVYLIYGNHFCLNAVARAEDISAGGVLIRAIQPVDGTEVMQKFRGNVERKNIANGPGKLTQALAITKEFYSHNLKEKNGLYITEYQSFDNERIQITPRIGISQATDKLWRFVYKG